jgi:hypothetical protein
MPGRAMMWATRDRFPLTHLPCCPIVVHALLARPHDRQRAGEPSSRL